MTDDMTEPHIDLGPIMMIDGEKIGFGRCATCRWAEWHVKGPMILGPIIGAAISPDVFAPMFEDYPVCLHEWARGVLFYRGYTLPPDFGCVMHEPK